MVIPGKPNLELRLLTQDDRPALEKFFAACESLGLENNKNAESEDASKTAKKSDKELPAQLPSLL